jgi:hypothetical protein
MAPEIFDHPAEVFKKAFLIYQSRGYHLQEYRSKNLMIEFNSKHKDAMFCLVPLCDMVNHNPPPSYLFRGDINTLDFHCDVVKKIEAGDEISTEYWQ